MKKMKIKIFIARLLEIATIILTIVLTIKSIKYATEIRGYNAVGGEYLIPIFGLMILYVIESINVIESIIERLEEK